VPISDERKRRRDSFDAHAALYDSVRPSYPREVFETVAELGALGDGSRIVEIGCGTGQATLPLARRGYRITCVELGASLAAIARRNLAHYPHVAVVNAPFEAWEPPTRDFEAVVSFSAFHWIDPEIAYAKTASLLRPGGVLAIVTNRPVLPDGGDPFVADVRDDYVAVGADLDATQAPQPDDVEDGGDAIRASGLYGDVTVRRHLWSLEFDADEYVTLLSTYSGHRALPDDVREALFARIRDRIAARVEPRVRIAYLAVVSAGRRPRRDSV
jgi:SAM-dependent methyltransferase